MTCRRNSPLLNILLKRTEVPLHLIDADGQLTARTHPNVAAVALANKLARMAWAVLAKNEPYRPPVLADAATD